LLVAGLAAVILWGTAALVLRLQPYWVAKYRGQGANLRDTSLFYAPLQGTNLQAANLQATDLRGADLPD
jgi:hypothetical protein